MTTVSTVSTKLTSLSTVTMSVAVIATVFDAVASYISIISNSIAEEGNALLNRLFSLLISWNYSTEAAFGFTMTLRAAFGIALVIILYFIAKRGKTERERITAAFGLTVVGVILTGVALYHVVGMAIFG